MSNDNKIQRYEHSSESLKKDLFEPITYQEDEKAIQAGIHSLNSVAEKLIRLKKSIEAFLNKNLVTDQEIIRLYDFSDQELEAELKRVYVISNEIKIQGLDVKLDKLTEIINIPDFSHILETFDELKASMKFLNSIPRFSIHLSEFFVEDGINVPDDKIDSIRKAYRKQTKNIQENRVYLAGRKILEGFAELEEINIKCTPGENFHNFGTRMLSYLLENKSGKIDVSERMYRLTDNS